MGDSSICQSEHRLVALLGSTRHWWPTAVVVVAGGVSADWIQDSTTLCGSPEALEPAFPLAAAGESKGIRGANIPTGAAAHHNISFRPQRAFDLRSPGSLHLSLQQLRTLAA